jgi:hypothetical protein
MPSRIYSFYNIIKSLNVQRLTIENGPCSSYLYELATRLDTLYKCILS